MPSAAVISKSCGATFFQPRRIHEKQDDVDIKPLCDFLDAFKPDGVAGNIDATALVVLEGHHKASDFAADWLNARWTVSRLSGRDLERVSARVGETSTAKVLIRQHFCRDAVHRRVW